MQTQVAPSSMQVIASYEPVCKQEEEVVRPLKKELSVKDIIRKEEEVEEDYKEDFEQ